VNYIMARFSGKIHSAKFVDIDEKTIEVLYCDDDSSIFSSWYLQVDYDNQDFLDFIDEYNLEDVANNTKDFYDGAEENYRAEIQAKAQEIAQTKFERWIARAQVDLDAQDQERYELFEEYKRGQMEILSKEVEIYALEKQRQIENELSEQREEIAKTAKVIEEELKFAQVQRDAAESIKKKVEAQHNDIDKKKAEVLAQLKTDLKEKAQPTVEKAKDLDKQKAQLLAKFRKNMSIKESSSSVTLDGQAFVNTLLEKNEDEDFVFKSKISLFNREEIKKHPDRELKMKIRQAKDIISLIAAYKEIIEDIYEESSV